MMNKKIAPLFFSLVATVTLNAQGIGVNDSGTNPDPSAALDVSDADAGLLIPRVMLTGTTDNTTISNGNVTSLLVFNTATVSDVTPGYYYWDGTVWQRLATGSGAGDGNGIYDGDGTTPSDVDVTVTDNIDFDNSTLFIDGTSNRIGVGTTNPSRAIHLNGSGSGAGSIMASQGFFEIDGVNGFAATNSGTDNFRIGFPITDRLSAQVQGTEFLRFKKSTGYTSFNAGRVGVGTTNPVSILDAFSTVQERQIAMSGSNVVGLLWNSTDPNPSERNWDMVNNRDSQGSLSFRVGNAQGVDPGLGDTKVIISREGDVGIGTTVPEERLDVHGDVKIEDDLHFERTSAANATFGSGDVIELTSTGKTIVNDGVTTVHGKKVIPGAGAWTPVMEINIGTGDKGGTLVIKGLTLSHPANGGGSAVSIYGDNQLPSFTTINSAFSSISPSSLTTWSPDVQVGTGSVSMNARWSNAGGGIIRLEVQNNGNSSQTGPINF